MILTGPEIKARMDAGEICIEPFNEDNLGPNSYDVTLNGRLSCYYGDYTSTDRGHVLDVKKVNLTYNIDIEDKGFLLLPGNLYLGMTNETAVSNRFVPMLEGRSSIGRLGINIHSTAGFGDIGWGYDQNGDCLKPTWTLEISVVRPVIIYRDIKIGQVYFMRPEGEIKMYSGKYSAQRKPQASMSFKDFEK